jgi:hypothetical protein
VFGGGANERGTEWTERSSKTRVVESRVTSRTFATLERGGKGGSVATAAAAKSVAAVGAMRAELVPLRLSSSLRRGRPRLEPGRAVYHQADLIDAHRDGERHPTRAVVGGS